MNLDIIEIGICDDDEGDLIRVEETLRRSMSTLGKGTELHIRLFTEGRLLYEEFLKGTFDLVFLDWEMPDQDGFELAKHLKMVNPSLHIVFVSAHENMAYDSFEYTPLWFVRKNCLERDLVRAMKKYLDVTAHTKISYRLKEGLGYRDLRIKDILYIESNNHNLMIHLKHGEMYQVYKSLTSLEEDFSKYCFLRIHKSFLVNQAYIKEVELKEVKLKDGRQLPLSKDRRKTVKEEMVRYEGRWN